MAMQQNSDAMEFGEIMESYHDVADYERHETDTIEG
jgi:hypothetical protein